MTWAQDQRIVFIKTRIDAGQTVTRADLREKFFISVQTATATFHEFRRRYPGLMSYCGKTKAMVPASWVGDAAIDWKSRCIAAEAERDALKSRVGVYRARLEIDHVWQMHGEGGDLVRVDLDHDDTPDGISCRDETIRLLNERIERLSRGTGT